MPKPPKKIVILAYDFPPYVSVGGIRPYNWYKFLHQYGIYPVVITRQWTNTYRDFRDYIAPGTSDQQVIEENDQGCIIRTPYHPNWANRIVLKYGDKKFKLLRKCISAYYTIAQYFFHVGPKAEIYKGAKEYLSKHKADAIVATGDPFILFKYASDLSKEFNIPWIPDYRDAWTNDPSRKKGFINRKWHAYWEKRTLKNASAIITVSKFIEDHTFEIIPSKPAYILPNGYDPDAVNEAVSIVQQNSNTLHIGYAGTIPSWAPIQNFLETCHQFLMEKGSQALQLNFYGIDKKDIILDFCSDHPLLKNSVKIHPKIPNTELLKEFAKNNVFLLFNYYSMMGTKIYDYIALKRKILLCYTNDEVSKNLKAQYYHIDDSLTDHNSLQEDLLNSTHSGIAIRDSSHLLKVLNELYAEFKAEGKIDCHPQNVESLSRSTQTKILAEIIHQLSPKNE